MNGKIGLSLRLAVTAGLVLAQTITAAAATWATTNGGSWATNANWDVTPAWDGSDVITLSSNIGSKARTHTLDGNRDIASLAVTTTNSNGKYVLTPGSPANSRIILETGNLTTTMSTTYAVPLDTSAITIQIGNGVTPVTSATWTFTNSTGSHNPIPIGGIAGIPGTILAVTGNNLVSFYADNRTSFAGELRLPLTDLVKVYTNNALGGGVATLQLGFPGVLFENSASFANEFRLVDAYKSTAGNGFAKLAVDAGYTVTLNGPLTGSTNLQVGMLGSASTVYTGALVVACSSNTMTGAITVQGGAFRVNGTLTNVGNVLINYGYVSTPQIFPSLEGTGVIGVSSGKTVTVNSVANSNAENYCFVAPGTDGTIGMLTVNNTGPVTNDTVRFDQYSRLKIDLSGTTPGLSDTLAMRGRLNLAVAAPKVTTNGLYLYRLDGSKLAGTYTLATYNSVTGTFFRVFYNNVQALAPTNAFAIGGTHALVYGATSLSLVPSSARGSLVMLR